MRNKSECLRTLIVITLLCVCWLAITADDANKTTTTSKVRYVKKYRGKIKNILLKYTSKFSQQNLKKIHMAEHISLKMTKDYYNKFYPGIETKNLLFDKDYLYKSRLSFRNLISIEKPSEDGEILSPYAIVTQMMRIFKHFGNANVTTEILGRTVEYNDIVLFKISLKNSTDVSFRAKDHKYVDEVSQKKIIFIVHGLTVMGIRVLSCLTVEDKLRLLIGYYLSHLEHFDIYLIPMANPDGYVMAGRQGVYWNKNRAPQADCAGVMLDHNFDVAWNSSRKLSSCSQSYPGPFPFSEPETRAIRDIFHYHGHKIIAYIHVHPGSYDTKAIKGDAILYPRGFTDVQTDDDKYIDLKGEVVEAIKNASFSVLSVAVDTLHSWYGPVTGTSVDYASSIYGIPFALEFVMQLYENNIWASQDEEMVEYMALTQVWRRMIDVVFNNFWKTLNNANNNVMGSF